MEKSIVNILIFNEDENDINTLRLYLNQPGNNVLIARTVHEADLILSQKNIGILLFSSEIQDLNGIEYIENVLKTEHNKDCFIIVTGTEQQKTYNLISGLNKGAVDFMVKPFMKNIVMAKIGVFKRLYFKNKTVLTLLENIFPEAVLKEFQKRNKYTPKKHSNCTILFTDFVGFSNKAFKYPPTELIKVLDFYFSKFDQIILKYGLEKIKTIGDSYMAVGGLDHDTDNVAIKTTLAALEIRDFMIEDKLSKKENGLDFWDIRIGMHIGDLVGGIIGRHKFSFDVWGDSVNIASRCEEHSEINQINVSGKYHDYIMPYFDTIGRGHIKIKNRGEIKMYFVEQIKTEFAVPNNKKLANLVLRVKANLPAMDFSGLKSYIVQKLESELDSDLTYHSLKHTLNVEESVIKYGELEGLTEQEMFLTRTAALFHDSGYTEKYANNEKIGVQIFKDIASDYGYSTLDIQTVEKIIYATISENVPQDICEKVICDADLDYLGRKDYHITAKNLFLEMNVFDYPISEKEWLKIQIDFLENKHLYYTISAQNIRGKGKANRIKELKSFLHDFKD